jgi:putative ABC transport system ATP-binding protein
MLTVSNTRKSFKSHGETVVAVSDAAFTAAPGEVIAIVGPSGSGKSTLLALLGLLERPDSGSIELDGVPYSELTSREEATYRASKIGFVFQAFNLIPNLTAKQNVMLSLEFAGWPVADRDDRAVEMLESVGLTGDKQLRRPSHLSGGEQQRVAIARAFAPEPRIILADEPTGALDRKTGTVIIDLLRDAASAYGAIVLIVTHDEQVAARADRQLRIEDGVLTEAERVKK